MASVANSYVREARAHFKNLRDSSPETFDRKVTCRLVGREKRWQAPPDDVVDLLFGMCVLVPNRVFTIHDHSSNVRA